MAEPQMPGPAEPQTPGPAAPRRSDAIANRRRLVDAARQAFAEIGATAEVKDIAERAGIGVGTIYRHFGNKDDLLREVIREAIADYDRDLSEWEHVYDFHESLVRHVTAFLSATDTYGWLFDAVLGGHLPESVKEGLDDGGPHTRLAAVLARGVEEGKLVPDLDLDIAANILLGLTVSWKYGELRETMTVEDAVERTLRIFLLGAQPR